jgi:hypothetical protein
MFARRHCERMSRKLLGITEGRTADGSAISSWGLTATYNINSRYNDTTDYKTVERSLQRESSQSYHSYQITRGCYLGERLSVHLYSIVTRRTAL